MSEVGVRDPLEGFTDDVAELLAPLMAPPPALLKAIGDEIVKKRDEAKSARTSSGIEEIWREAERAYIGIDKANRAQFAEGRWEKPMSMDGPVTTGREPSRDDNRSTIFVRITARYTDAAAAKLSEILLAPDDKSFSINPTPIPDLIKAKDDNRHVYHDALGPNPVPLYRNLQPGEQPPQSAPGSAAIPTTGVPPWAGAAGVTPQPPMSALAAPSVGASASPFPPAPGTPPTATGTPGGQPQPAMQTPPGQAPLTVADLAKEALELAEEKAQRAEDRIYGWMLKSQYRAEARKVIFDCARLGVGVFKGPFPKPKRVMAMLGGKDGQDVDLQIKDEIIPAVKWVNPWNCFPDPACGENIHDGDYFLERDFLSDRQVRELDKTPGYIKAQLLKVIAAGPPDAPKSDDEQKDDPNEKNRKGRYEVWYFYGALKLRDFQCLCSAGYDKETATKMMAAIPSGAKLVYGIVTMIGDVPVRASLNPLDSGSFPYHSMPWQRRADHWAGIGVPEQMNAPQRIVNGGTRAMLDNAGLSAGPQIVVDKGSIVPENNQWGLTPNKVWNRKADSIVNDNKEAFSIYNIPNTTEQLKIVIDYGMQLAEESTSIPLITQGQSGQTTPETYGAAAIQDTNANQLLRSIAEAWDDNISEPMTRQFYEWLLLDPNVPDEDKGDFEIDAHGSVALVERAIQDQTILQLGATAANPIYGLDPKKWSAQLLKSKRLKSADFTYSPEDQAKIEANPVVPPAVQVAKTNQDTQLKVALMKSQGVAADIQSQERINAAANELEGQKASVQATVDLHELQMRHELAMLEHASRHQMTIDQVKAKLADRAMTLQTQERLNAADNAVELHKHHNPGTGASMREKMGERPSGQRPPAKVPGKRAGNGRQFEQAQ